MAETPPPPDHEGHGDQQQTEERFRFGIASINRADIRNQAYEQADERLQQEQHELLNGEGRGGRIVGHVRNIWRQTFTRSGRRQRHMREAEQEMLQHQNIHQGDNADVASQHHDMEQIMGRVAEGFLRPDEENDGNVDEQVAENVREYIRLHANNAQPNQLEEAIANIRQALHDAHQDTISGISVPQLEVLAEQIRLAAEQENNLEEMLNRIDFYEAQVRSGVRTEVQRSAAERLLERFEQRRGVIIGIKTAVLAVSAAAIMTKGLMRATGKIASTVLPGVAGAAIAGINEVGILRSEHAYLERADAKGHQMAGENQPRRQELAGAVSEKITAQSFIDRINTMLTDNVNPNDLTEEQQNELVDTIAAIELRERTGRERGLDLISFSGSANIETERFSLDRARARAEHILMQSLGVDAIDDRIENRISDVDFAQPVLGDLLTKDANYRRIRNRRVIRAMGRGALFGLAAGIAVQEVTAVSGIRPNYHGIIESTLNNGTSNPNNQTFLQNVADATGISNGAENDLSGSSGFGSDNPVYGEGPGSGRPVQVTHVTGPNQIAVPDRHDPNWNYHIFDGEMHGEKIHEGYETRLSNGFRLVHEVHGEGSNAGYITLQDVYGNVIVGHLAQGPGGLTADSIEHIHQIKPEIQTNFFPPSDEHPKGILEIVIPKEMSPAMTAGVDVNPTIPDLMPPILAPFATGRRELEYSPRQTPGAPTGPAGTEPPPTETGPGPEAPPTGPAPTTENEPPPTEYTDNFFGETQTRANGINDRGEFNNIISDLEYNNIIDLEEGDSPELGENNIRIRFREGAPERYRDLVNQLIEAQRRIENRERDTFQFFDSIRQRIDAGLDRSGLNNLVQDLITNNIITLQEGLNPSLADNNVRFNLNPEAAERYQEVFDRLREQQRSIEDDELNITIDFSQNFEAQHPDDSGTLDNLIYDRYANVFGITSTFGRENLREQAAESARNIIIKNIELFRNRQAFESMGREIDEQLTQVRAENGDLRDRNDLGINAAAIRLDRQTQKAEVFAAGNMAVIYISDQGDAEYLTANQTLGGIEGGSNWNRPQSRTSVQRMVRDERAKKAGESPEEQDRIERELQEKIAEYNQVGSKKVEAGGRFVLVSRATFGDMGWDEDGMLERVKDIVAGKSSTEATQAILELFPEGTADKSALVVDVNERT